MPRTTSLSKLLVTMTIVLGLLATAAAVSAGAGGTKGRSGPMIPDRIQKLMRKGDPRGLQGALGKLSSTKDPKAAVEAAIKRALLDAAGIDFHNDPPTDGRGLLLPAGDLNGDGKKDALEWYFGQGFAAVRGSDGLNLWKWLSTGYSVPIPVASIDGDATADVIGVTVQTQALPGAFHTIFTYRGLSGRDGTILWTRTYDNVWTDLEAGPTKSHLDLDFAIPMGVARMDADGVEDLLIGNYNFATVKDPATGVHQVHGGAVFEVVGGKDGRPVAAFPATGRFEAPNAILVPDGSLSDVIVLSPDRPSASGPISARLTAYPGEGGAPRWTVTTTFPKYPALQGLDLNGDPRGDLLAVQFNVPPSFFETQLKAFSGSTGGTLWTTSVQGFTYPVPAGDTNGDKGQELLVPLSPYWGYIWTEGEGESSERAPTVDVPALPGHEAIGDPASLSHGCYGYGYGYGCGNPCYGYGYGYGCGNPCYGYGYGATTVTHEYGYGYGYGYDPCGPIEVTDLGLIDGALGQMLWTHTSDGFYDVQIGGDATGDGVRDALFSDYRYDPVARDWVVKHGLASGADGSDLWTSDAPGSTYTFPLDEDLNGDGKADLLRLDYSRRWDQTMGVSGTDGTDLWASNGKLGGYLFGLTANRLGNSGNDLLETIYRYGQLRTAARSGADGSRRWMRPSSDEVGTG